MSRFSLRKIALTGLGAALVGSGLTVGLGAGVASAAPNPETCKSSVTVGNNSGGSYYEMTKEVIGGKVAPGGEVTFINTYRGAGGIINEIGDYAPAGFTLVKAKTKGKLVGLISIEDDVTNRVGSVPNAPVTKNTWSTAANSEIVFTTTYRAPDDLIPGTTMYAGGGQFNAVLVNGYRSWNPIENLCLKVVEKGFNEAIGGSLEDAGLGSMNTASLNLFRPLLDPTGSIGDVVSGLPLGDILGGLIGGGGEEDEG